MGGSILVVIRDILTTCFAAAAAADTLTYTNPWIEWLAGHFGKSPRGARISNNGLGGFY